MEDEDEDELDLVGFGVAMEREEVEPAGGLEGHVSIAFLEKHPKKVDRERSLSRWTLEAKKKTTTKKNGR